MPAVSKSPANLSNLYSIVVSCQSSVVPWVFYSESGNDLRVNSLRSLLSLFLSRLADPVFLIRAKRGSAVMTDRSKKMSENDFQEKIEYIYASKSVKNP